MAEGKIKQRHPKQANGPCGYRTATGPEKDTERECLRDGEKEERKEMKN